MEKIAHLAMRAALYALVFCLPAYASHQLTDMFDGASGTGPVSPWSVAGSPTHNGAGQLSFTSNESISRNIGDGDFKMNLSWTNLWLGDGTANYESCYYSIVDGNQHFNIKMQEQPDSGNIYLFCHAWISGDPYRPEYDYAINMGQLLGSSGARYDLEVEYDDTALTFKVSYSTYEGPLSLLLVRDVPAGWTASTA